MKNLDYNEIKIFINLEIIGEEKLYLFFFLNLKTFLQFLRELRFFFLIYYNKKMIKRRIWIVIKL